MRSTLSGREIVTRHQIERGIDRAMGGVADRIALDAQPMADDVPLFLRGDEGTIELGVAVQRQRHEQARRVFERIERRRQSGLRQARGNDAGLRGAADLEGFCHGAEIGDQTAGHRGGDRHGGRRLRGIETAQLGAGRRRRDRSKHG